MRTIEELEAAGAAAATIEDTVLPQRFGETAPALISVEEFAGKLKAAVAARRDPAFAVVGRTSALARTGLDDALRRVEVCNAAGVDAIFVAGGATPASLRAIADATDVPLISGTPVDDEAVLVECRCVISTWSHLPFFMAAKTIHDAYAHLYKGGAEADLRMQTNPETTRIALAQADYDAATRRYLT
jgi:carboxyvinyl-carboxyphosphonate phosphorylmutase